MPLRRLIGVVFATAALAACSGADPSWPVTVAPPVEAPSTPLVVGPGGFVMTLAPGSAAAVRVREQLGTFVSRSDVGLMSNSVSGRIGIRRDGTVVTGSAMRVLVADLRSDNAQRDRFVKEHTLDTRTHPVATFVPTRVSGLSLPLRAEGAVSFKVTGTLTINGVAREVTLDVNAHRAGHEIHGTARNATALRFGDFGLEVPRVMGLLSVVDEIRLEVQIVAIEGQK